MSEDWKCVFCGSDKIKVNKASGDMVRKKKIVWGEDMYEIATDFCCRKQAANDAHRKARYDPRLSDVPDLDDIAKL